MRPQVQRFRNAAVQVCRARGFPFQRLLTDFHFEDILEEADLQDWPTQELAVQTLLRSCLTNGVWNNFQVGLLTVMTALRDRFGPLGQGEQQAYADLVTILRAQPAEAAVRAWMATHYP